MIPDPSSRACVTADEAFAELGIDRTTGYRAIREGTFPVPVIRVGRLIRVPTAALRRLFDPDGPGTEDSYPDDSTAEEPDARVPLGSVPRPALAHHSNDAAPRLERTGGQHP